MAALYVTSEQRGAGKTALCAGLAKHFIGRGKKIGFFKLFIAQGKESSVEVDGDAAFMKQVFALKESVESICPTFADGRNLTTRVKEAFARLSQGRDVVIIEGVSGQDEAEKLVEALGAKVIVVADYSQGTPATGDNYKSFGKHLLGVVVNKVPRSQYDRVFSELCDVFGKAKLSLLGVLPEERTLGTLSVAELAAQVDGKLLNNAEQSGELVESIMLGAMVVDSGLYYYGRKANKAVVIRSERPDMQMAALETSTKCLILSGTTPPQVAVAQMAESKRIPVISAPAGVANIAASLEEALAQTRFRQEKKLPRLVELMEQYFNFKAVAQALGYG